MLGVRELVVNTVAGEKVKRLVDREVQCLVRRGARNWRGEWEPLPYGSTGGSNHEGFVHQDRYRGGPIEAERSIGHLVKQVQVLDRSVVKAICCPNAGLSRTAKNLAQRPVAEARRIGKTEARTEIIVSSWSKRLGNVGITREHQACRRKGKNSGRLSGYESLQLS